MSILGLDVGGFREKGREGRRRKKTSWKGAEEMTAQSVTDVICKEFGQEIIDCLSQCTTVRTKKS